MPQASGKMHADKIIIIATIHLADNEQEPEVINKGGRYVIRFVLHTPMRGRTKRDRGVS
jgi:hypothetical protein